VIGGDWQGVEENTTFTLDFNLGGVHDPLSGPSWLRICAELPQAHVGNRTRTSSLPWTHATFSTTRASKTRPHAHRYLGQRRDRAVQQSCP
jgi:hypothetical protein